jgi:drug/metabolite transporter (DMT)-like permease
VRQSFHVVTRARRPASRDDRAAATIALLAVFVGSMGVVVRQVDAPAVVLVWARALFAIPPLAWFVARQRRVASRVRPPTRLLLLNGVVLSLHWTALIAAFQRAPIGTVLLITYLSPVGIAALAPKVLGEHVPLRSMLALALSVVGVAAIAIPSIDSSSAAGVALAVITAVIYVALALLNKRLVDDIGGAALALWQVVIASVALLPFAALTGWGSPGWSWLWLPVLGAVYTAGFFGAYLTALQYVDASRAAILLYLEPASAVLFGWLLLSERPSLLTVVGGLLIVAGGLLVVRSAPLVATAHDTEMSTDGR